MKKKSLFLILLFAISVVSSQTNPISKTSQCAHCNMIIKDAQYSAKAFHNNDEIFAFDAIECLVSYLQLNNESNFRRLMVADYLKSGTLIMANKATFLISSKINSPMGAHLAAFSSLDTATKTQLEKGGELFSWEQLKSKLSSAEYGQIEHNHHNHARPDAYAPVGIMGDHLHKKNGLMVSVRTMYMTMEGNRLGNETIENSDIFENYMVVPQQMDMQMYMVSLMYAPSDKLTLMLMQNIIDKNMDLQGRMMMDDMIMFRDFSTSSSAFGDMKLNAMYGLIKMEKSSMHINGGISIPLGAIQQKDDTPMMKNMKLPYAMQLGSGTLDATLGVTYRGNTETISWGVQPLATLHTGKNSEAYRLGEKYQMNLWGAYKVSKNVSLSTRVLGVSQGKIKGIDSDLNPMMVTTADVRNTGYDKIKGFIGTNVSFMQNSPLKRFRLGIEAGIPLYQDYNGIQMNEEFGVNLGLLYTIL